MAENEASKTAKDLLHIETSENSNPDGADSQSSSYSTATSSKPPPTVRQQKLATDPPMITCADAIDKQEVEQQSLPDNDSKGAEPETEPLDINETTAFLGK